MLVLVALAASGALALLALRSMAYAFANTVDARPHAVSRRGTESDSVTPRQRRYLASGEAAFLMLDVLMSVGICLAIVGLASMAALPGRLIVGAILAQFAILGSLVAPACTVRVFAIGVRPAAVALGLAQLANAIFFIKALQALL